MYYIRIQREREKQRKRETEREREKERNREREDGTTNRTTSDKWSNPTSAKCFLEPNIAGNPMVS